MRCDTCKLWNRKCLHTSVGMPHKKRMHCCYYRKKDTETEQEIVFAVCPKCLESYPSNQIEENGNCANCNVDNGNIDDDLSINTDEIDD